MQLRQASERLRVGLVLREHARVKLGRADRVAAVTAASASAISASEPPVSGPTRRSMKPRTWLSGNAPMKPSIGWPRSKAMTAGID